MTVPTQHTYRSIYVPIENAFICADTNGYGWGAVLNDTQTFEARGFWHNEDRSHHANWKELRTFRLAMEFVLPRPQTSSSKRTTML
jgi:hypothetical protein